MIANLRIDRKCANAKRKVIVSFGTIILENQKQILPCLIEPLNQSRFCALRLPNKYHYSDSRRP